MSLLDFFRKLGDPVPTPTLSAAERQDLARQEDVIRRHVATYQETGTALASIRDRQLYRETHATYEAYLAERWEMSAQHAHRLIAAAAVAATLEPTGSVPKNERQARALASLPEAEQLPAWLDAQQLADGGEVETIHVEEAAAKRKPTSKRKTAKPITIRVPGASITITPNKAFTTPAAALTAALAQLRSRDAA